MKRKAQAPRAAAAAPKCQRGIVMIVALIVMVALSLAGVALVRSIDTTVAVVGNLAYRQAALLPANLAVEQAAQALFADANNANAAVIPDKTADFTAENYFAARLNDDDARGIPVKLQKKANFDLPKILYADNDKYYEVRYVIERSCLTAGLAVAGNCDMLQPKVAFGTTTGDAAPPSLPQFPFYRVTVRVDGPQNTTTFLQAMLR